MKLYHILLHCPAFPDEHLAYLELTMGPEIYVLQPGNNIIQGKGEAVLKNLLCTLHGHKEGLLKHLWGHTHGHGGTGTAEASLP